MTKQHYIHVPISEKLFKAWKKFRDDRKLKRGPLEEAALLEYMERHAKDKDQQ